MRVELVAQGGADALSLAAAIAGDCRDKRYDRLDVAVAYATVQGLQALERLINRPITASRWILGLDDAITQPAAIEKLQRNAAATLRLAKLSPARRFHPKLYRLWASADAALSVTVIGSGNMTERGLQANAEAAVVLRSDTAAETQDSAEAFDRLWRLGHAPDAAELAAYRDAYARTASARKQAAEHGDAPPEPAADAQVSDAVPVGRTSENVIALAVCRIAANHPVGVCTYDDARRLVPKMIALTPGDLSQSASQPNAKWVQVLRNIQSNARGGAGSTNFIANGYLEHVPGVGYRVTATGRALLA